jgi:tetratricopeptide (TPR) repeat protein
MTKEISEEKLSTAEDKKTNENHTGAVDNNENNEVEKLKNALQESENKYLRALAEIENNKKRYEKIHQENLKYAISDFAKDLLVSLDVFNKALNSCNMENISDPAFKSFVVGIDMTKKDLLKMAKEFKNNEYYDVIYYTLGEIEEKERNAKQALYYYKKSVQTSLNNPNQKGLSYLKLGEINFDLANYQPAGAYYDSAVVTISKEHPDYASIVARKKTLETLVGHIRTISNEDSLQKFVKFSENEQNRIIDKIISDLEKEEARLLKEKENAKNGNQVPENTLGALGQPLNQDIGNPSGGTSFYFYNQNTISFGIADFTKKWGNRKLEDNWRRSNKALIIDEPTNENDTAKNSGGISKSPNKTREYYRKNLPVNDTLIKKSNKKIIYAYYMMGSIYKEELNNTKKAVAAFEELTSRFPQNKYLLNTYYILYRTHLAEKNQPRSDYYKEKILSEFPDSEFALIIKNPSYASESNSKQSEVEAFYGTMYQSYNEKNYPQALSQATEGLSKFGKNLYAPKFEFVKSLCIGKLKGIDSLEFYLKLLVAKHPQAEVTPLANDILLSIKKQKNPDLYRVAEPGQAQLDTFMVNFDADHFLIAIVPDDPKIADGFKIRLNTFNNTYYSSKTFNLTSNLFGSNKQLIVLKTFASAKEVTTYYENLLKDPELFKEEVKKEMVEIYPILGSNLPRLYRKKNVESYKTSFHEIRKVSKEAWTEISKTKSKAIPGTYDYKDEELKAARIEQLK